MTIEEFGWKLRARGTSAVEITEQCLRRIDADNGRLNAFILVMADQARREARDADADLAAGRDRGPLHGVPISVKDIIDIKGTATTAASRVREGHVADRDAPVVTYLRHAGAVLIGKTNLHEFAFGTTNEDSAFGPARNPLDPTRSPGGSSGGSAVSVAAGMALASIGTDTGGSIRIPAAACGIAGLKPTIGEISTEGVVPLSKTLDHVGPLAQTATDAWHVYHGLLGRPPVGPLNAPSPHDIRVALLRTYFCDILDDEVRGRIEWALGSLRRAGVSTAEARIPHVTSTASVYFDIAAADAAAYHAGMLEAMPDRYTAPVRERLLAARSVRAIDYIRALESRDLLRREVDEALSGYDALILPTLPIPAPSLGQADALIGGKTEPVRSLMLRLTQLFDISGHPAISIPCGNTSEGLPCGLQLVGARRQTDALLRVAVAVEKALASG